MKNLIIGFIVFLLWTILAIWLLLKMTNSEEQVPDAVQEPPVSETIVNESLAEPEVPAPNDLMIHFDFNKAAFKAEAVPENRLAEFKSWLNKNPESMLIITGHTDEIGPSDYNQLLGLRRAVAVQNYLEKKGFDETKLLAGSKGEEKPESDLSTKEGRAKNRRAVITLLK